MSLPERVWVTPETEAETYKVFKAWPAGGVPYVPESRLREVEAERDDVREKLSYTRNDLDVLIEKTAALRAALAALVPLARLGLDALEVCREGMDLDGGDIQDAAEKYGVIHPVPVDPTWPCQVDGTCECEPGTDCYRDTAATTAARAVLDRMQEGA